jgi:hypothetical protein
MGQNSLWSGQPWRRNPASERHLSKKRIQQERNQMSSTPQTEAWTEE